MCSILTLLVTDTERVGVADFSLQITENIETRPGVNPCKDASSKERNAFRLICNVESWLLFLKLY